jgi:hypothetical protein
MTLPHRGNIWVGIVQLIVSLRSVGTVCGLYFLAYSIHTERSANFCKFSTHLMFR